MVKLIVKRGQVFIQYFGMCYSEEMFSTLFPEVYHQQIVSKV